MSAKLVFFFFLKRQTRTALARQEKFPELISCIFPQFRGIWGSQEIQKLLEQERSPGRSVGSEVSICGRRERIHWDYPGVCATKQLLIISPSRFHPLQNIPALPYGLGKSGNSVLKLWGQLVVFIENCTFNTKEFPFFGLLFCPLKSLDLHI